MKDKPSQSEIEAYLKWLNEPDGDAHLQIPLPLGSQNGAEGRSDSPDYGKSQMGPVGTAEWENVAHSESDAVSRIRALGASGMSIRGISIRTGCAERFIETVFFKPGRINRRYE